eukprot:TRINITY_DN7502_c0_g3_i2.p1 TRINITY_DN7502_c0_g3~~TRINITY_DN7502_c0_g3_i2.p1  ORF type:complete len:448 (-),score=138.94 TRINITY_DN7502_c0_g3_i2:22-1248(-)
MSVASSVVNSVPTTASNTTSSIMLGRVAHHVKKYAPYSSSSQFRPRYAPSRTSHPSPPSSSVSTQSSSTPPSSSPPAEISRSAQRPQQHRHNNNNNNSNYHRPQQSRNNQRTHNSTDVVQHLPSLPPTSAVNHPHDVPVFTPPMVQISPHHPPFIPSSFGHGSFSSAAKPTMPPSSSNTSSSTVVISPPTQAPPSTCASAPPAVSINPPASPSSSSSTIINQQAKDVSSNVEQEQISTLPPLLITLAFDTITHDTLESLRVQHFPKERNFIPAHISVFHALPQEEYDFIDQTLTDISKDCLEKDPDGIALNFVGVRRLGGGFAIETSAPRLVSIQKVLSLKFDKFLTRQDRTPYKCHVTIMNKVDPKLAKVAYEEFKAGFNNWAGKGSHLVLWEYLGGPWRLVKKYSL